MKMRRDDRLCVNDRIQLSWTDEQGAACQVLAEIVDISDNGMKIELAERIPVRTHIVFRANASGLQGSGTVRYCIAHKLRYWAGVEFLGGLKPKPKLKPPGAAKGSFLERP